MTFEYKYACGIALMGMAFAAHAVCPSAPGRFVASGAEVTDSKTGLIWARCAVGQSWDGSTCSGTASIRSQEAALAGAQALTGWRLPNIKELSSLVDRGCNVPAIDASAFPNPALSAWSSSPYSGDTGEAWHVDFGDGNVYHYSRYTLQPVRLVRISP